MTKIKSFFVCFSCILLVSGFAAVNYGQDTPADRAEVPLTDPAKPAVVKVGVHHGSITVTGFNGKSVIVEAKTDLNYKSDFKEEKTKERSKKAEGMHMIRNMSTGLNISEENNVVDVKVYSLKRKVDVNIKVPFKTSLKLKGYQSGEIKVENVDGEMDVAHYNGPLTLKNVSGTVVASSFNGDLTVTFNRVNLGRPMSFSTFNGDIDVTFPKDAKFNLKLKSEQGEIYSDFKLQMQSQPPGQKEPEKKKGKYVIRFDKDLYGLLNGGGEEIQFKTFSGDIFIREKK